MAKNKKDKVMWFEVIFFVLNFLIVGFLYKREVLATVLLLALTLFGLKKWKIMEKVFLFCAVAIILTIGDVLLVFVGVLKYSFVNLFGISSWLLIFWINLVIFMYRFSKKIELEKRKW